ncbi:MAG TPA: thioredoxin TrxC [Vicinamibacterales bacterium]|nr:thioredoxin TrxC [Vicinamibacterales bacterium]
MSSIQLDNRGFIIACDSCGQKNRVPYSSHETRCGKCKTTLRPPAEPIEVASVETFDALIRSAGHPVVVDFWAPWCGPCRMVAPEIAKVAASNAGRLIVVKVNTDALPELGERYRIRSIPTMAIFEDGREAARTTGAMPAAQIESFVNGAVKVS